MPRELLSEYLESVDTAVRDLRGVHIERYEEEILLRFRNCQVSHKEDGSEVTEADKQAELLMRKRIEAEFPDHAILGEEFGDKKGNDSPYTWVLDPVDGTASFAIGLPTFGTLVALKPG